MKLELKETVIPVLGWCDISVCSCYIGLEEEVNDGESIIHNCDKDLDEDELCTFIFYTDYSKEKVNSVYSGRIQYLGRNTDHSAPLTYEFYPEKEIEIKGVGYCKCCGEPKAVMLKTKKL